MNIKYQSKICFVAVVYVLMPISFIVFSSPVISSAIASPSGPTSSKSALLPSYLYRVKQGDTAESIAFEFLQEAAKKDVRQRFYAHNHIHPKQGGKPAQLNQVFNIPMSWMYLKPMTATVLRVSGAAAVSYEKNISNAQTWQALNITGQEVRENARIKTDNDGFALLEFPDHSLLSISPNSTVLLETVRRYANSDVFNIQVQVENGRIESQVKTLHHPASEYSVKSKRLSTAVRGTRYSVSDIRASANATTEVLEGGVSLSSATQPNVDTGVKDAQKAQATLVTPGFAAYVADGKVSPLVALLAAPQWACAAMNQQAIEQPLVVSTDKKTQLFSLNVYAGEQQDLNKLSPVRQLIDTTPRLPVDLPVGNYTLQLKAVDEHGIYGFASQQKVSVKNNPNPPEDTFHWQQNPTTKSWALLKIANNVSNKQLTCMD